MKTLASILLRAVVSAVVLANASLLAFAWFHTAPGWLNIVIILSWMLVAVGLLNWTLSPLWR